MSAPASGPSAGQSVELQGYPHRSRSKRADGEHLRSAFIPLLILLLALLSWSAFQWLYLGGEAQTLEAVKASQDAQLQQAQRVRQALDALGTETRKLAEAGNGNARQILDELRKRGVTINPPASPSGGK